MSMDERDDLEVVQDMTTAYTYLSFLGIYGSTKVVDPTNAFILLSFGIGCWIGSIYGDYTWRAMRRKLG